MSAARLRRSAVGLSLVGALTLPPGAPALAAGPSLEVKVGAAKAFSRLELHGAQPAGVTREGRTLTLRFARGAAPDMARLHVDPPPYLKSADLKNAGGAVSLVLTLADGAEARTGSADGAFWVNLAPAPAPAPAPAAAAAAPPPEGDRRPSAARPDPVPVGGVVRVAGEAHGETLVLRFPWKAPLGAAVFRRGEATWIVFDAAAKLDLARALRGAPKGVRAQPVSAKDFTALRVETPSPHAAAAADGATWIVTLGPEAPAPAESLKLAADLSGPAALSARLNGATGVYWMNDPAVGDRLAAVTALAPAKGLAEAHAYVGATVLASAQGLGLQALADDLSVSSDGDLVRIGRPRGLALSAAGALQRRMVAASADLPQAAAMPALVDFGAWSKLGEGGFNARYAALRAGAAEEAARPKGGPLAARMALARFLVGSELTYEGIGVLNSLGRDNPALAADPEWRGLRGAARAMAGRWKDAEADFAAPVIADDPASALWRGYVAARQGDAAAARTQFANGASALHAFSPKWRARFGRAAAEAALAQNDLPAARSALDGAASEGLPPEELAALQLTRARVLEAQGQREPALALYEAAAATPFAGISTPALLHVVQLKLAAGRMKTVDAMATLDSLRFRWRGDATELEVIRALGQMNLAQGRYREALAALRSAGGRLPDLPAAYGLQTDLATAFKALFLDGQADGLQPIQALALFYDFKELTPVGADGDLMVRRLVRRLVDVDLLGQAAELLKYQVENRLDGVAKAQVATDLATIDLMDRRPEDALDAINSSRTTVLPAALNAQRRLVEARALTDLGRTEHALEVLGSDQGPDAAELRATIAWRGKDWAGAGKFAEARLGERWKSTAPLTPAEAALLMRAGSAYSLAADDAALARLRARYGALAEGAPQPEALKVALAGVNEVGPTPGAASFAARTADGEAFSGWVGRMKAKFRAPPAVVAAPPAVVKAAAPAKAASGARKT